MPQSHLAEFDKRKWGKGRGGKGWTEVPDRREEEIGRGAWIQRNRIGSSVSFLIVVFLLSLRLRRLHRRSKRETAERADQCDHKMGRKAKTEAKRNRFLQVFELDVNKIHRSNSYKDVFFLKK